MKEDTKNNLKKRRLQQLETTIEKRIGRQLSRFISLTGAQRYASKEKELRYEKIGRKAVKATYHYLKKPRPKTFYDEWIIKRR